MLAFVLGFLLFGLVLVWLQAGSLHAALTVSTSCPSWSSPASLASFGLAALLGALAAFMAWTGAYGSGILRLLSDDKPAHERCKARYGWK